TGYWPDGDAPPDGAAWDRAAAAYRADGAAMQALVADPGTDLFARIPHGDGQTVLREALLVADHAAYHLGQLVVVRRLLGCWPEEGLTETTDPSNRPGEAEPVAADVTLNVRGRRAK